METACFTMMSNLAAKRRSYGSAKNTGSTASLFLPMVFGTLAFFFLLDARTFLPFA